jgi:hypothetical protein
MKLVDFRRAGILVAAEVIHHGSCVEPDEMRDRFKRINYWRSILPV